MNKIPYLVLPSIQPKLMLSAEAVEKPSKRDFEPYFCVVSICFCYVRFFQKGGKWIFSRASL